MSKPIYMTVGVKLPAPVFKILQAEAKEKGVSLSKGISAWITNTVMDNELRKAKEAEAKAEESKEAVEK